MSLELEMTGPEQPRSLSRVDDVLHAQLPFAWLLDVWARDLTTVQGRFCLNAKPGGTAGGEHWELDDRRARPADETSGSKCGSVPLRAP